MLKRQVKYAISGALLGMISGPAFAQSVGDIAGELVDNSVFELNAAATGFTRDLPSAGDKEDNRGELYSTLTLSTEAVLDEDQYTYMNLELVAMYGTLDDLGEGVFRTPNDKDKVAHWLDLKRLSVFREILDGDGEVFIGKELVEMGVSELYSPSDRFNQSIAVDPTEADDHGTWQIGVQRFIEDDTFVYRFIPVQERAASPNGDNRWLGTSGDSAFSELPSGVDVVTDDLAKAKFEHSGHLLSYSAVRDGYDWFGFVHHGQAAYPILERREEISLTNLNPEVYKIAPMATTLGGGAAFIVEEWKLYSEVSYQHAQQNRDQDFFSYSAGFSYRETEFANSIGFDEIKPILEYGGEWIVDQQKLQSDLISNSSNARANKNTVMTKLEVQVDDTWTGVLGATHNLNDDDNVATAGVRYKYDDNLKFRLNYAQFNGPSGTYYGNWAQNDYVKFGINYKF